MCFCHHKNKDQSRVVKKNREGEEMSNGTVINIFREVRVVSWLFLSCCDKTLAKTTWGGKD